MFLVRFNIFAAALALLAASTAHAADDADCLKQVFGEFCLGGAIADRATATANTDTSDGSEIRTQVVGGKQIVLEASDGKIIRVSRLEPPGSWLNFTDWKRRLVRQYGRGEDQSSFPAYATSRSSRLNAIRAARGSASMIWPQKGWHIELIWNAANAIELRYAVTVSGVASDPNNDL